MAGVLRQSCTSCSRYLTPASASTSTTRSFQDQQKLPLSAPASPQKIKAAGAKPYLVNHVRNHSNGYFTKTDVAVKEKEWMQIRSPESARQSSTYRKPVIDIPAFIQLLSVLNIDLPRYFPDTFRNQNRFSKSFQNFGKAMNVQVKEKSTAITPPVIAKDDSIQNLREAEGALEAERESPRHLSGLNIIQREQHDLSEAMDGANHGISYFSTITFPDVKAKKQGEAEQKADAKEVVKDNLKQRKQAAEKTGSTSNIAKQLTSYIPYINKAGQESNPKEEGKKKSLIRQGVIAQSAIDKKTRGLVQALRSATRTTSQLVRLEELCSHLSQYPDSKNVAVKEKIVPCLLKLKQDQDQSLQERAREGLALVGYTPPVLGRGIRVLTLDGGGTRGLVSLQILKQLEEETGKKIYDMFDYICGVSTGALIASLAGVHKIPLDKVEKIYREFSTEVFAQYKLLGAGKLVMSHAYYDSAVWEKILKLNIGETSFLETARDATCPKLSAVSCLMNVSRPENFLFRNYNHAPGVQSHYPGSCQHKLWEAIRASSAAPGYFEEYKIDNFIHQDGGLLTNNPTAIAIHECRLLWPNDSVQCVISLGTGKHEPTFSPEAKFSSLKTKLEKIVESATDTEAVHTTLQDLLPPSTYFRFNPYMSEEFSLDEIRPDKWEVMVRDASMYCRKNDLKLKKAAERLQLEKYPHQKVKDWLKLQSQTHEYSLGSKL